MEPEDVNWDVVVPEVRTMIPVSSENWEKLRAGMMMVNVGDDHTMQVSYERRNELPKFYISVITEDLIYFMDPTGYKSIRKRRHKSNHLRCWTPSEHSISTVKLSFPDYKCPNCGANLSYPENMDGEFDTLHDRYLWCPLCKKKGIAEKVALSFDKGKYGQYDHDPQDIGTYLKFGSTVDRGTRLYPNLGKDAFDREARDEKWRSIMTMSAEDRHIKDVARAGFREAIEAARKEKKDGK